jgi:phosphoribosylpyrophosphate synthetase
MLMHAARCAGVFQEVIVTNTIPLPPSKCFPELTVLSVAPLLGENIWKVYNTTPGENVPLPNYY